MMSRRGFLRTVSVSLLATPRVAEAQQAARKVHRIGYLAYDAVISLATTSLVQGLQELGYVEGRDFIIDYRAGGGWSTFTTRPPSNPRSIARCS